MKTPDVVLRGETGMRGMVKDTTRLVSVAELRRMLYNLRDHKVNVCIRFRKLGEMWKPNFMQVVDLNERGAIFNDMTISEFIFVMDLDEIMQFELDGRFHNYEPFNHYEVTPWDTDQASHSDSSVTLSS